MAVGRFVAYYRVSTDKQGPLRARPGGPAGGGASFLDGGGWTLAAELTEVESGKRNDRPELAKAIGRAACTAPPWWSPSSTGWRATWPSSPS